MSPDLQLGDSAIAFLAVFPLAPDARGPDGALARAVKEGRATHLSREADRKLADELETAGAFFAGPGAGRRTLERWLCAGDAEFEPGEFVLAMPGPDGTLTFGEGGGRTRIVLTLDPETRVGILLVNLRSDAFSIDRLIHLSHSFYGAAPAPAGAARSTRPIAVEVGKADPQSIRSAMQDILRGLETVAPGDGSAARLGGPIEWLRCVEIKGMRGIRTPDQLAAEHPRELYGLLMCDEGWRHVPREVARERLARPWVTREFMAVHCFDRSCVSVNFKPSEYIADVQTLWQEYLGATRPYIALRSEIAGLEHGPLAALWQGAYRLVIAHRLQQHAQVRLHGRARTGQLRSLRKELVEGLGTLRPSGVPELAFLEERAADAIGVPRVIATVREELGEVDAEVRGRYERRMNVFVFILTGLGVLIAALQLLAPRIADETGGVTPPAADAIAPAARDAAGAPGPVPAGLDP